MSTNDAALIAMLDEENDLAEDLVLTVTCRESRFARHDTSLLRWFTAHLATETLTEEDGADPVVTDVADAEVVLVSLQDGLAAAFLEADGIDGDISTPLEHLRHRGDDTTMARQLPGMSHVLILDQIEVPEQLRGRGYGTTMIREIVDHFDYLLPATVVLAWPSPTNLDDLDPFTARAAVGRMETVLDNVGMQRLDDSPFWCATLTQLHAVE
ncbi:N-acetyltransferase [Rudaeicoccus suwonensis]|uniref:N-acetyltransferase n=1 Tax=Rudaeicoccus suwonensis TaxID=657409 RepID=UPI0011A0DD71|nr:N-acetyltransferase [Rudaeicoccus suwonensis]